MFEPVDNLPAVLSDYFVALNERDFALTASFFTDHVDLIVDRDAEGTVRPQTREGVTEWTKETMPFESVAIAPVTASLEGLIATIQVAVTAIRESGEAITLVQQIDYRIENGLISGVHAYLPRRRREAARPA